MKNNVVFSGEKVLCLVTKNISPDVEIVASSRAKLMGTEEENRAGERKHQESNCRNHVEVKMEVPEVEREGRSSVVKHEPPHEHWTINSRTFPSSTSQQQTHGKNIMIQNLLNRPSKPTYGETLQSTFLSFISHVTLFKPLLTTLHANARATSIEQITANPKPLHLQ